MYLFNLQGCTKMKFLYCPNLLYHYMLYVQDAKTNLVNHLVLIQVFKERNPNLFGKQLHHVLWILDKKLTVLMGNNSKVYSYWSK